MVELIVRYLRSAGVPFRLVSYPSPEAEPHVAHPMPPHSILVESRFLVADGQLVLACLPAGEHIDLATVEGELGVAALEALPDELPEDLVGAEGAIPPLGQPFGTPLLVDQRITDFAVVVFEGSPQDIFEVPYEDLARQEAPKVFSFTRAGELPEHTSEQAPMSAH
jgi:hypothetical protein